VLENSSLLGYCAVSVGEHVWTFRMIVLPSKRRGVYIERRRRITRDDVSLQLHRCENLKPRFSIRKRHRLILWTDFY
jgi:hypothetical protein